MKAAIFFSLVILILEMNQAVGGEDALMESITQWMKDNPGWIWTLHYGRTNYGTPEQAMERLGSSASNFSTPAADTTPSSPTTATNNSTTASSSSSPPA